MLHRSRSLSLVVSFVLILTFGSAAVLADVTGSIQGVVRDRTQGAVAAVRVTVTNTATNLKLETISGPDGSYRFLALPAGNYRVNAIASGFRPFAANDIVLQVNDQIVVAANFQIPGTLNPAGITNGANYVYGNLRRCSQRIHRAAGKGQL